MLPLIIIGVIVLLVVLAAVAMYNGLIKLRNLVQEAWRQIDVELKRRHDLIPNLVETVKGYAAHERGTLEGVMQARSAAMSGGQGPAAAAQSEGMLSQALGRLFAVAEAYPDLKANANFLALQQELTSTEDRIAAGRRYYNANVRELNTKVETVPSNVVAGVFKIGREEYFEVEGVERDVPGVTFGAAASRGRSGPPRTGSHRPDNASGLDPAGYAADRLSLSLSGAPGRLRQQGPYRSNECAPDRRLALDRGLARGARWVHGSLQGLHRCRPRCPHRTHGASPKRAGGIPVGSQCAGRVRRRAGRAAPVHGAAAQVVAPVAEAARFLGLRRW